MTTTPTRPTPPHRPTIEDVLARELRDSGLTQAQIGFRLGMSRQAVSDRMRGRTRWDATDLPVVCQLLGITVSDVYRKAGAR